MGESEFCFCIQLNELMKLNEYQRSRSFFDLGQRSFRFQSYMFDFGLYTQVSDSGPHGPLVFNSSAVKQLLFEGF